MHALTRRSPDVKVTISAPPPARGVFALFPEVLSVQEYPPRADQLDRYDYLMGFEHIEAVPGGADMSLCEVFSQCLHTPRPESPPPFHIPEADLARRPFEDCGSPRVAVHAGPTGSLRSCPQDQAAMLVSMLVDAGVDVYLVGGEKGDKSNYGPRPNNWTYPLFSYHNLINMTPTPADLAAVLMRMHVLVTCDSFPMHLAGAMGVATIALLASTSPALAGDYPTVTILKSGASCSPCGVAEGACPLGQPGCVAQRDPALDPKRIAQAVLAVCHSAIHA